MKGNKKPCIYCSNPSPTILLRDKIRNKDAKKMGLDKIVSVSKISEKDTEYSVIQSPEIFVCDSCGKTYSLLCAQSDSCDCKEYVKNLLGKTGSDGQNRKYDEILDFMREREIQPSNIIEKTFAVVVVVSKQDKKNTYIEILFDQYYLRLKRYDDKNTWGYEVKEMYYLSKRLGGESFLGPE